MVATTVPAFVRRKCEACQDKGVKFELGSTQNESHAVSRAVCRTCEGFGYVLEKVQRLSFRDVIQISSPIASALKKLAQNQGVKKISEELEVSETLVRTLINREKRSCTREIYTKITYLIDQYEKSEGEPNAG